AGVGFCKLVTAGLTCFLPFFIAVGIVAITPSRPAEHPPPSIYQPPDALFGMSPPGVPNVGRDRRRQTCPRNGFGRSPSTGTLIAWEDPPYGSGDTMPTGAVHGSAPLANGRVLVGPLHSAGIGLGPRAVADAGGSVGTNGPGGSPHSVGRLSERPGMLCGSASATGATADSACCLAKAFASSLARA